MDEHKRHALIASQRALSKDLRAEDTLSYLQSVFVLGTEDTEIIKDEKTSRRKVEKLLQILQTKGSAAFKHFYDALIDSEYYHLAELLEPGFNDALDSGGHSLNDEKAEVATRLRDGGVPQRPLVYVSRSEASSLLKNALFQLQHSVGWVILHGMAGSGKTVLASQILHDFKLLQDCFPGEIFWLSVGSVDNTELLTKMQNLCMWLDNSDKKRIPRNLEDAKNLLRTLIGHQHPRSLLVLDDLWKQDHARYFDIQARILVTTRNVSVADHIGGLVVKVPIPVNLTFSESKELLAGHMNMSSDYLPEDATDIIKECMGSPLAIALIGALLKCYPTRWGYYLKELRSKRVSNLKSKLAYEYPTLYEAINTSVNHLPDELKRKFQHFALFDENIGLPAEVFCVLWEQDVINVEDIMDELRGYSLVKRLPYSPDFQNEAYGIHGLQLAYLKESLSDPVNTQMLKDLHINLVDKYFTRCNKNWAMLENDGYIHWHLINHLIKGGQSSRAADLLMDFSWIIAKIKVTGTPDLITNYDRLIKNVDDSISPSLKDFRNFIGAYGDILTKESGDDDVIQLALGYPLSDVVYQKARKEAIQRVEKKKSTYFDWTNLKRTNTGRCENMPILSVQHHSNTVFSCNVCPVADEKAVVSCGRDGEVKVWNIETGKLLTSLKGHNDTVYCCRFSADGELIVTSSADKTIRVWRMPKGSEIHKISGHQGDVYCCDISPDKKTIISCSVDRTVRIWDSSTGFLINPLLGHTDVVNCCAYSPDGTKIVTSSNDLTVKIWNSETYGLLLTYSKSNDFYSFCTFLPNGKSVLAVTRDFLQLIDVDDQNLRREVLANSSIQCLSVSADGQYALSGHSDSTTQIWNTENWECIATLEGHSGFVYGVSFSLDSSKIVTACADGTCKVWDTPKSHSNRVKLQDVFDVAFYSDDKITVFAADSVGEFQKITNLTNAEAPEQRPNLKSEITTCTLSADHRLVCLGCKDGNVKVFQSYNLKLLWETKMDISPVSGCCFSGNRRLVLGNELGNLKVLDAETGESVHVLSGHEATVTKLVPFNNLEYCLSSSFDGTLKVWNIAVGTCIGTCTHKTNDSILCCDISPDDEYIVSGSAEGTAKLWEALTCIEKFLWDDHENCVRCAKFSPDSKSVLTGGDNGDIKLWSTSDGICLQTFLKHTSWVQDLQFSKDGSCFVSVSDDIKIWKRNKLLQTFTIKGKFMNYVRASADFKTFVTIDNLGELYILKVMSGA